MPIYEFRIEAYADWSTTTIQDGAVWMRGDTISLASAIPVSGFSVGPKIIGISKSAWTNGMTSVRVQVETVEQSMRFRSSKGASGPVKFYTGQDYRVNDITGGGSNDADLTIAFTALARAELEGQPERQPRVRPTTEERNLKSDK